MTCLKETIRVSDVWIKPITSKAGKIIFKPVNCSVIYPLTSGLRLQALIPVNLCNQLLKFDLLLAKHSM